jgi:putative flippase GtrA
MAKYKASKEIIVQFIKFGIVGLSNTFIGLGTYYFFLWLGWYYIFANVMSWVISVLNSFFWNRRFVFKSNQSWYIILCRTYVSYGFSFVLGTAVLFILVEFCNISNIMAPLLVLIITIPLNFLLNKFWAFK